MTRSSETTSRAYFDSDRRLARRAGGRMWPVVILREGVVWSLSEKPFRKPEKPSAFLCPRSRRNRSGNRKNRPLCSGARCVDACSAIPTSTPTVSSLELCVLLYSCSPRSWPSPSQAAFLRPRPRPRLRPRPCPRAPPTTRSWTVPVRGRVAGEERAGAPAYWRRVGRDQQRLARLRGGDVPEPPVRPHGAPPETVHVAYTLGRHHVHVGAQRRLDPPLLHQDGADDGHRQPYAHTHTHEQRWPT